MSKAAEQFSDALIAMAKEDFDQAIIVLTGSFVGLTLEYMKRRGYETHGEIKIDGGNSRDITIHPIKEAKHNG